MLLKYFKVLQMTSKTAHGFFAAYSAAGINLQPPAHFPHFVQILLCNIALKKI
jgi:hypothetical protein